MTDKEFKERLEVGHLVSAFLLEAFRVPLRDGQRFRAMVGIGFQANAKDSPSGRESFLCSTDLQHRKTNAGLCGDGRGRLQKDLNVAKRMEQAIEQKKKMKTWSLRVVVVEVCVPTLGFSYS